MPIEPTLQTIIAKEYNSFLAHINNFDTPLNVSQSTRTSDDECSCYAIMTRLFAKHPVIHRYCFAEHDVVTFIAKRGDELCEIRLQYCKQAIINWIFSVKRVNGASMYRRYIANVCKLAVNTFLKRVAIILYNF